MQPELADLQNATNGPESVRATLDRTVKDVQRSQEPPDWVPPAHRDDWRSAPAPIRDTARKHAAQLKEKADDYNGALDDEVVREIKARGGKPGELLGNAVGWVRDLHGPDGARAYAELGRRIQSGESLGYQMQNDAHLRQEAANKVVSDWSADKPHFSKIRGRMAQMVEQDSNAGGSRFLKNGEVNLDAAYQAALEEAGLSKPASASRASSSSATARSSKRPAPESVRASIKKALSSLR
jgi:hypothetical protein